MLRVILVGLVAATPATAGPEGYGHMGDWGYGHGVGMMFGPVLWLIVLGLVVAGVVWFVRGQDASGPRQKGDEARAALDMRFAKGEIDAEDYAARRKLLED